MKIYQKFFLVLACSGLLSLAFAGDESLADCSPAPSINIEGYAYTPIDPTSIQEAYDYASNNLALPSFTLQLAEGIFTENLTLDGGAVVIDGGYDCTFTTKDSTSSILGTITISTGSLNFTAETKGFAVVSTDQCFFDRDGDNYTSIGSCSGTADDCNDNNFNINPDAVEICDGIDNNCNGQIDEGATGIDADGDGYYAIGSCGTSGDDCNDNVFSINPGAVEIAYDGIDQDCNGTDLRFAEDNLPQASNCGICHGILPTEWDDLHALVPPPNGSCAACHNATVSNILPGHYGKTVRTAGNNMAAGATIVCASCHDQVSEEHNFGANVVMAKVFAAWANNTLSCDTCHENRAAFHEAAHDNRVITAICADCHTSDTSIIGQPGSGTLTSQADVDTLHRSDCILCHGYSGTKLSPTVVAQAIQDGINGTPVNCLACHYDFGTIHAFLENHNSLVTVGSTSCGNCHSDPPPLTSTTDPKVHSSCFNCHDSSYNTIGLAAGKTFAVGGDCKTCHTDPFDTVHPDTVDHTALVTVGTTSCGSCHSDPPPLVDPANAKVHNACSSCHDADGGLINEAAGKSFDVPGDCTTCHIDPFDTFHPADIDHSALIKVGATGCGDCHSDPPPLVDPADAKVHNACASCHDAEGGLINEAAGKSFASPGNCTTCHTASFDTFHPLDIDHSALVKVETTSCGNCHSDPPPLVDPADAKVHNACLSCHDNEGSLINEAAGKTFASPGNCTTCHTGSFDVVHPEDVDHSQAIQVSIGCDGCHAGPPPVVNPVDPKVHDFCTSCHDAAGALISLAAGNPAPNECVTCHGSDLVDLHPSSPPSTHEATPGSDYVLVFADGSHDDAMDGDGVVYVACSSCHSTNLGNVHDNNCAACHSGNPSPYDTLNNSWAGGCQQGGCHTTYHDDATTSHWTVEDQCTTCHGNSFSNFPPLPTSCANCHASYSPSDTSPPTTTSNVQPSYIEPARIEFSMTDNGKIGIGTIYSKIDGGVAQTGSSILVYSIGSHTLEYWGVDQAGNEELPHNFAAFEILADTTPPVTTSNAATNYYNNAVITLTATDDNGTAGVQATYYTLNGGSIETYQPGSPIFVAKQPATVSYTLQFWSVDWNGNVETAKVKNFTVHGSSTLRLVWENSDIDGSPCSSVPGAAVAWTIRSGTTTVASGSDSCPDWSGVNDVLVSSGRTYSATIDWYLDGGVYVEDQVVYPSVAVPNSGEVITLRY